MGTFLQLAKPSPPLEKGGSAWGPPSLQMEWGGKLAVWCEQTPAHSLPVASSPTPWLALHGGPGGACSAALVAPLRAAQVPWVAFDQRNSGLSDDLALEDLDTQRLVDDMLTVLDHLGLPHVHVLAGSWGAFLALQLAAQHPERVGALVLRAPFVPWPERVDAFFRALELAQPDFFQAHLGQGARTQAVCDLVLNASPKAALRAAWAWSKLEMALLSPSSGELKNTSPPDNPAQHPALLRKYRLQAHFLMHDCFTSREQWLSDLDQVRRANTPVHVVQGMLDRVCPPGGAFVIHESLPGSRLTTLAHTGHLAQEPAMTQALTEACQSFAWR